jgi:tetratricopeptide (TPR) repeat protein
MSDPRWVESLGIDQRERWQKGERVRVEAYIEGNPALRSDPDGILDLIYNEVVLREEAGDAPRLEEYVERFPQFRAQLRLQFEVHRALEANIGVPESSSRDEAGSRPPDSTSTPVDAEGLIVPGYEIIGELGRGGMGVVYLARQVDLKRRVAIKMILAGVHADPRELARFRTEAEAVARLQHPNVVQIYEVVDDREGRPCFALELVEGGNLAQTQAGAPWPARQAGQLMATLAHAMEYVHRHGIIHRDLKPSNVLLTAEGVAKISDFGLAKLLDVAEGQTPSEAFLGTPSYMAPEQAAGRSRDLGTASDVYSLGAILYELLTGRPPFRGETSLDTVMMVVSEDPVPPTRLQPKVPRDLETICLKCLEKEPRHRYGSAADLADDLGRFLAGEPIRGRPTSLFQRSIKWARRRPAAAALLGVGIAALLSSCALAWWSHETERRRLDTVRAGGRELVTRARVAMAGGDLEAARLQLTRALTTLGPEPTLGELADQAGHLLAEAERKLGEQKTRRLAEARRQAFDRWHDEALFRGTQPVDVEATANLRATEAAAREALAVVGMADRPEEAAPAVDPAFNAREKGEILAGCFEILLVLADAETRRRPGQTTEAYRERVARALRILDRAAGLGPATRAYSLRRSRCLAILGDARGAEEERLRAAALAPDTATDAFLVGIDCFLGDGRDARGDLGGAIRNFVQALRLRPDYFWAQYYLALCYLNSKRPELADSCLTGCLGRRPDFLWAYLLRGYARGELRDFQAAEDDFRRASELGPNADASYALLVNRGAVRIEQGRFPDAAADLERAVALKPDGYRAAMNLALLRRREGRYVEALADLDRATRLDPPANALADIHTERIRDLILTHQYQAAVDACDALLASHPDDAEACGARARALLELGHFDGAARSFTRYLENGGTPTPDVYRGRGQARMKLGDYPGAVDDYTRALQAEPGWDVQAHRGWAYFFSDAPALALRDFDRALELNPGDIDARIGRGLSRVALGRDHEAVADAEDALRHPPDSPEMIHNIACIFAQAAGRAGADRGRPDGPTLEARYRERALTAIRRALDRLPAAERPSFFKDKILPDRALDPIRQSPEFLDLMARMGQAPTGSLPEKE